MITALTYGSNSRTGFRVVAIIVRMLIHRTGAIRWHWYGLLLSHCRNLTIPVMIQQWHAQLVDTTATVAIYSGRDPR